MSFLEQVKQIPSSVVETVKVNMMTIHTNRRLSDLAVHSDSCSFTIFSDSPDGIPTLSRFYGFPVIFI